MTMSVMTTTTGDLNAALEEAIAALTHFDADKLEEIEGKVSALIAGNDASRLLASENASLDQVIANHRLLGTLLASTSLNLNVLERLHNRNAMGETSWVR
jgi:hypothetical protein